jgi:hypothetical protein
MSQSSKSVDNGERAKLFVPCCRQFIITKLIQLLYVLSSLVLATMYCIIYRERGEDTQPCNLERADHT